MDKVPTRVSRKIRAGWGLLAGGATIILLGAVLEWLLPGSTVDSKLVMGAGILVTGWAGGWLTTQLAANRFPEDMRRMQIEEKDERSQTIRQQAGYTAFRFSSIASGLAWFVYTIIDRRGMGLDPFWYLLTFLAVGQMAVYIGALLRYDQKY